MDNGALNIIFIIYALWAYYSGWKWISGRFAFLEKEGVQYKILKAILGFCVGCVIGAFYLLYMVLKLVFRW